MTDDFSWNSALCVAGIHLTTEERAAGWPDAFTPENLACLQYPWGGSGLEKKTAAGNQRLFIATMLKAIQIGGLPAIGRTRTEDITEPRQVPDFFPPGNPYSGGLGSSDWQNRDRPRPMRTVKIKVGERTVPFFVIERGAFRDWLTKQGLEPSEHTRAWLGTTQAAHHPSARGAKRPKKMDVFLALLEQVESAWVKSGRRKIDRRQWPGTSKELHILAGRLMPEVFGSDDPESFYRNYPKEAGLAFGGEKDTRAVYAELFPPAAADQHNAA